MSLASRFKEGSEATLAGDVDSGEAVLRDCIKATVGLEQLSAATGSSRKSLSRMVGRHLADWVGQPGLARSSAAHVDHRRRLSIAAISYYVVILVTYAPKAAEAAGLPVHPELATGASIPVVGLGVAWLTRRIHRRLQGRATTRARGGIRVDPIDRRATGIG